MPRLSKHNYLSVTLQHGTRVGNRMEVKFLEMDTSKKKEHGSASTCDGQLVLHRKMMNNKGLQKPQKNISSGNNLAFKCQYNLTFNVCASKF